MNKKTLLFLDALAENDCAEKMTNIARDQMKELFRSTFRQSWPGEQTIWVTSEAQVLRRQMEQCWNRIQQITRPSEAIPLLKQIPQLQSRWQALDSTTREQLYLPGNVKLDRIHVILRVEEQPFCDWFLELVQIQMYRILTLGGAERFRKLPQLNDRSAEGLLSYYRGHILPALETLSRVEQSGIWAFAFHAEMKLGGGFTVPGCQLAQPQDSSCSMLPGHYIRTMRGKQRVYEGRGALTNITPLTILQAQRQGFCSERQLRVSDLLWMQEADLLQDPTAVLERSTNHALYAVDPYDFFSKWGYACGLVRLRSRHTEHSCPLCGGVLNRQAMICEACRNVMVQI